MTLALSIAGSSSAFQRMVSNWTAPSGPLTEKVDRAVSGVVLNSSQISWGAPSRT